MKKLSTIKFYNSSRSITLVLVISPSEVIWGIWISNGRNFNHNFGWVNDFNLKSCQLQIWTTFWGLQHLFWVFRHPRLFENSNLNGFKWKSCQLQSCITFWDLQFLLGLLLHQRFSNTTTHSLGTMKHMSLVGINFYEILRIK